MGEMKSDLTASMNANMTEMKSELTASMNANMGELNTKLTNVKRADQRQQGRVEKKQTGKTLNAGPAVEKGICGNADAKAETNKRLPEGGVN
ncbi:hypothetical protein TNCV_65031 [Trichonephila clavipes]|nr:hypothetical protein TNCV_65031 [Trichonephila clavipes]